MASVRRYFWMGMLIALVSVVYYAMYVYNITFVKAFRYGSRNMRTTPAPCRPKHKLLVIFTTFRQRPEKFFIHRNVIINWGSLSAHIQPLFFGNLSLDGELGKLAQRHGWKHHLVPQWKQQTHPPVLKDMYRLAKGLFPGSAFYGYSNGDILFTEGLVETLEGVSQYTPRFNSTLVVGRRTNVNVNESSSEPFTDRHLVAQRAANTGKLYITIAEDYFFIGRPESFPWHTIVNIVIGRPAYDNYFVAQAIRGGVAVVDATNTLLAVHQTGKDGNSAGARNKDRGYNNHIIGPYNYALGATTCAPYWTARDIVGKVFLQRKPQLTKRSTKSKSTCTHR